jgi:hypothetical protein
LEDAGMERGAVYITNGVQHFNAGHGWKPNWR